jgi:cytochrome P450
MSDYRPVTDWRTDWDHADPAWAADPFTITDELRQSCPVAHTDRYGGAWMPTTLALIDEVLHETATYSSRETGVRPPGTNTKKSPPITSDPPEHQDHRRVLLASFAPKAVARLEPELRAYCRSLVGAVGGRERFDAAASYSQHIPTKALAGLLGLPDEDAGTFRGWVRAIMVDGHDDPSARATATAELKAYLSPLIAARRGREGDDVLTVVANAELHGEPLDENSAVGMAYLLVVAGVDTTWSALGTALWHLGTHPDDLARLAADPSLIPVAVEELLRAYAPVSIGRIAAVDTKLGGCPVASGQRILLPLFAANRDPATVDRPDEFVLDRSGNRHAAFGLGVHRCLGSNLARLELRVALEEWLVAFPRFAVVEPVRWTVGHVRGPHALLVQILQTADILR